MLFSTSEWRSLSFENFFLQLVVVVGPTDLSSFLISG